MAHERGVCRNLPARRDVWIRQSQELRADEAIAQFRRGVPDVVLPVFARDRYINDTGSKINNTATTLYTPVKRLIRPDEAKELFELRRDIAQQEGLEAVRNRLKEQDKRAIVLYVNKAATSEWEKYAKGRGLISSGYHKHGHRRSKQVSKR